MACKVVDKVEKMKRDKYIKINEQLEEEEQVLIVETVLPVQAVLQLRRKQNM